MFKFLVSTKNLELNKVSLIERKKYLGDSGGGRMEKKGGLNQ